MEDLVDYSRQDQLYGELNISRSMHSNLNIIIGCGGIGYWLGIMLAMFGETNFILIDGDKIEASNLNRLPVPQTWLTMNKAVALRKSIRHIRPATVITVVSKHLDKDAELLYSIKKQLGHLNFKIWDCTDDAVIQREIYKAYKKNIGGHYRKMGYEGLKLGSYEAHGGWMASTYQPGYRTTQSNAITSAMAAGIGIFSMFLRAPDVNVDLEKLIMGGKYEPEESENEEENEPGDEREYEPDTADVR